MDPYDDGDISPSEKVAVVSSINKAVASVRKGDVVVIIVPGEVTFSYDVPTYNYDSDNGLHAWLRIALLKHVILLKCEDVKIQTVIEISRLCHFDVYAILDFPDQKTSGSAISMISSLPRISHSDLELFGKIDDEQPGKAEVSKNEQINHIPHIDKDEASKRFNSLRKGFG